MTKDKAPQAANKPSPPTVTRAARREARLAKALRANIAKRKEQAQARLGGKKANGDAAPIPPDSTPETPGKPPRSA